MSSTRAVIADDEALARRRIRSLLQRHADVEIIAECADGQEAVRSIRRDRPDLVFLDIQMPRLDGFGVIREIGVENMPALIFVTAFDEHALRAFEVNALDYLLKPFDQARFDSAMRRVRRRTATRSRREDAFQQRILGAIADFRDKSRYRTRFAVKTAGRIHLVPVDEIDWIEAAGKYVRLHAGREIHLHRASIGGVEAELDPRQFVRIHRSTIVNVERIKELQPLFHGEFVVILRDGTELTLSRGHRDKLRDLLDLPE